MECTEIEMKMHFFQELYVEEIEKSINQFLIKDVSNIIMKLANPKLSVFDMLLINLEFLNLDLVSLK